MFAVKGAEDVSIHVRDHGGGIPRRLMGTIFEYLYTTAVPVITSSTEIHVSGITKPRLLYCRSVAYPSQWLKTIPHVFSSP